MRWRQLKLNRYPIWSARSVALLSAVTIAVTAALVCATSHKPFVSEMLLTLALVAAALFVFLLIGLYRGVRIKKENLLTAEEAAMKPSRAFEKPGEYGLARFVIEGAGEGAQGGAEGGPGGLVIGCLLGAIIGMLVFSLLLAFAVLGETGVFLALPLAVYWLFSRALRQVFIHAAKCHANLPRSALYALSFTALYTGWMFALLALARYLRS